jgi:hypothetical protein
MTDAEIDNIWLEAFKAAKDDGRVRQRFAELCRQNGAAEMKVRCVEVCEELQEQWRPSGEAADAICAMN